MKISYVSDIHLEFGHINLENKDNADVLVLAGDICVAADMIRNDPFKVMGDATYSARYHEFFKDVSSKFKHIIYVMGNHEFYHGDIQTTVKELKSKLSYIPNLTILDREVKKIDDVIFIGSTLWTDMNDADPLTILHLRDKMNDFKLITNSDYYSQILVEKEVFNEQGEKVKKREFVKHVSKFSPDHAYNLHKECIDYIKLVVEQRKEGDKFVVVGHHAPSIMSVHPRYKHDSIMNGGYMSSLEEFIIERPAIKAWIHGHVHDQFDYMVGSTRVVCNPRGYIGYEVPKTKFDHELKTIEV